MTEPTRTTTTGDPRKDSRQRGDGAEDLRGDDLHHTESAMFSANSRGIVQAWREKFRRRPGVSSSNTPGSS